MPDAKAKKETTGGGPIAWENPLIPNKKLRSLYVAMVELRLLDEHIDRTRRRKMGGLKTIRGEEGCRVSTTFDLKPGDVTSEGSNGVATSFLRGAKLAEAMHRASLSATATTGGPDAPGQLPAMAKAVDRLHLAMGAAFTLKGERKGAFLVAYTHSDEAKLAEWKPMLRFASQQTLPVIFVVLPAAHETKGFMKPGQLSLASSKCGVPGITVDVADPVALYRVAQESMLRARAAGGPVLMECIAFRLAGKRAASGDPVATMREFLLGRKIVDEAWLEGVTSRFRKRLEAVER